MMIIAVVAGVVAAVTAAYLIALAAAEGFTGAHHLMPLGTTITVVAATAAAITYAVAPMWWILVWLTVLIASTPITVAKLTRTYPRRRIRALLTQRLATVLGSSWSKNVTIAFTKTNTPMTVTINIPAAVIPSEVAPRLRSVIGETLTGTWAITTKGTRTTATRRTTKPDTPVLRKLKAIVCAPKAFTSTATITQYHATDDGQVLAFSVKYSPEVASSIALGYRKRDIQNLIRELLDPGPNNSWSFDWKTQDATCNVRRSVFAERIDHKPTTPIARSLAEATRIYPDLTIPVGVDEFEQPVTWKLVGKAMPHGLFVGLSGSGKSSTVMTVVTALARPGVCIIIVDFKGDREYDGFLDWPNVHLVTRDFYSNLRAIAYVRELMYRRKTGGAPPAGAPPNNVPIMLIIDEFTVCTKTLDALWPQFRQAEPALPKMPPTMEDVGSIYREGRSLRVHGVSALQRATADNIPAEFKFNSPFKIQAGHADSTTSWNLWDNADIGQTIPQGVPGRALTRGPNGFVQFQGYFTPDPAAAADAEDRAVLDALRPPVSLYPRVLIDMPNADTIERWDQIVTAPIVAAAARPDLDPLSPKFQPRRVLRVDTTSGVIDAASMQLIPTTDALPAHTLDADSESDHDSECEED
ncbi:FtsK/SpoIIIE domain-containing protein [Mycobacterium talmoniae]|uniref:FtsK domain-containing protein n=1 Tax=Mycobacterium talmoniae TaxID=1858794 RepID=A0A1S1NJ06_9MYCO|nr:FtsK/SpoIIIE domain-containing protein [Mycobacterium talmoniae]OHV00143.1 hypothetical protein BKN37_18475 [Mycobacterium talmoniae]